FFDGASLADELIEPAMVEHAVAVLVDVDSVRRAWRYIVQKHTEGDRLGPGSARQHEMSVSRVEPEDDAAAGTVEDNLLRAGRPLASERPLVEAEPVGRGLALSARVAEVGLRCS